jgi:hypothetical protein
MVEKIEKILIIIFLVVIIFFETLLIMFLIEVLNGQDEKAALEKDKKQILEIFGSKKINFLEKFSDFSHFQKASTTDSMHYYYKKLDSIYNANNLTDSSKEHPN